MELVARILAGAAIGALAGLGLSRVRTCSTTSCSRRGPMLYSIIAGAVFGAAVGYYLATR
ncbi:MAG: hypothetical protein ACE15C_19325 [Phycisphaerae bacterium]